MYYWVHICQLSRHGAMFNNQCSISFQLTCSYCENDKGGFEGSEYDRHLIAVHSYDYCKLCWVMGPRNSVRLHIATTHPKKVFLRQQQGSKNDEISPFPYNWCLNIFFSNSSFASFAVATVLNLAPQKE